MSINRYNYEEFFLLYADGELSPLETEMVNQFVQFHPDLKEELDILMDCKLVADMPVFFPKEKLFKQTIWDTENIGHTQSRLLLLLDNELIGKDKEILEKSIEENPVLQYEWNTLQQAKLPAENIAHPYKKPLYKEKKIPKLGWLRWAAVAAALVGAGLFLIGKNDGENKLVEIPVLAKNEGAKKPQVASTIPQQIIPKTGVTDNTENENGTSVDEDNPAQKTKGVNNITQEKTSKKSSKNKIPNTVYKESPEENNNIDITQEVAINNNTTTDETDGRATLITNKATDNVEVIETGKPAISKIRMAPRVGSIASTIIKKPSQNATDLQVDADDEYVRIAGARVKKQKIRGVFRGVLRGLGRTFSNSKVEAAPAMALNNE